MPGSQDVRPRNGGEHSDDGAQHPAGLKCRQTTDHVEGFSDLETILSSLMYRKWTTGFRAAVRQVDSGLQKVVAWM